MKWFFGTAPWTLYWRTKRHKSRDGAVILIYVAAGLGLSNAVERILKGNSSVLQDMLDTMSHCLWKLPAPILKLSHLSLTMELARLKWNLMEQLPCVKENAMYIYGF